MAIDGLVTVLSRRSQAETVERLIAAVTAHGAAVLACIDHAKAAAAVDLTLLPTEVILFGNARAGTPLMQAVQTIGLDLPLRALVWTDAEGVTRLGYNDPAWLAERHGAASGHEAALKAMQAFLAAVAADATG